MDVVITSSKSPEPESDLSLAEGVISINSMQAPPCVDRGQASVLAELDVCTLFKSTLQSNE